MNEGWKITDLRRYFATVNDTQSDRPARRKYIKKKFNKEKLQWVNQIQSKETKMAATHRTLIKTWR